MIEELLEEIDNWLADYIHLGRELGQIINDQQDIILKLQSLLHPLKASKLELEENER